MWRYGAWFILLAAIGCQNLPRNLGSPACPPDCAAPDGCGQTECRTASSLPCPPKPQAECRPNEEIQINVPRQRVIVPRRATESVPNAAIESQQVVQTR